LLSKSPIGVNAIRFSILSVVLEEMQLLLQKPASAVRGLLYPANHTCSYHPIKLLVIALDVSPVRLALARHNAAIYGVADRIEFILADYISFANMYLLRSHPTRRIDVVFLSPPWGGPGYLSPSKPPLVSEDEHPEKQEVYPEYSLSRIKPIHGADLFHLTKRISNNIAYFLPKTTSLQEISALLDNDKDESTVTGDEPQMIDVEEEWIGSKLTALTCYFGGLVAGKEHMM